MWWGINAKESVHRQSRVLLRRPATGVSGQESLSSSEDEESRLSPIRMGQSVLDCGDLLFQRGAERHALLGGEHGPRGCHLARYYRPCRAICEY
ncbi:hypothetical protein HBH90_072200 [Parastagonospora nodorum]|nr:hypothetical protein HBH90_072200 [Parastagonospora nodorum]